MCEFPVGKLSNSKGNWSNAYEDTLPQARVHQWCEVIRVPGGSKKQNNRTLQGVRCMLFCLHEEI